MPGERAARLRLLRRRRVYRLRDACAALRLGVLALDWRRRCGRAPNPVAAYVCACAADLVRDVCAVGASTRACAAACAAAPYVCVGRDPRDGVRVCVLLPTYAEYFFDHTLHWARVAYSEMARQYVGRGVIAQLQTVGGGWASLHRADRSLMCALQLHAVALAVFDEESVRKCRLFIGWAHLWNSNRATALRLFRAELAAARRWGDDVHEQRCLHAIVNAERNPRLAPGGAHTSHYQLVDMWSRAFA
ncbi:hypothetical protein NESM_000794800 [Novymonas esmeraldas]|uniref:Uncharacterized protein n=1 Tax=Novymonas esmeraldas TaxID=1808958 RepID=A0AAW0EZA0_9TRYP